MKKVLNINNIEEYLGMSINEIKGEVHLTEMKGVISISCKTYSSDFEKKQIFFLKNKCRTFFVNLNEKNNISSIFLGTKKIIDKNFYDILIKKYGKPNRMLKMGDIKESTRNTEKHFVSNTIIADTLNCSFEKKPEFIIWDKLKYSIDVKMDYIRDTSLIRFELK